MQTGITFAPTHILKANWGYEDYRLGFADFRRATEDTPIRLTSEFAGNPNHSIAYMADGSRIRVRLDSLRPV